jgi:hypothetical protein
MKNLNLPSAVLGATILAGVGSLTSALQKEPSDVPFVEGDQKWEYKILYQTMPSILSKTALVETVTLNIEGKEGWELVSQMLLPGKTVGGNSHVQYTFKQPR